MKKIHLFLVLLLLLIVPVSSSAMAIKVTEAAVTTKVTKKGKPIDSVHRISHRTVRFLYFFTRTTQEKDGNTSIKHLWFKDDKLVKEAVIQMNKIRWRSYSTLPIDVNSVGQWRVELKDEAGTVLRELEFKIH